MDEAYRQIGHHLHLLIHLRLVDDTWRGGFRRRYVAEVRELTGAIEQGRPVTHVVYHSDSPSHSDFFPRAEFVDELAAYGFGGRR